MTCIAYCKGIMACDSAWSTAEHELLTRRSKIVRLRSGAIVGEAGDDDSRHVLELFDTAKTPKQFPTRAALLACQIEYEAILVLPNGRIFEISIEEPAEHQTHWTGGVMEVAESYYACGSGRSFAMTAIECGKSAREAVECAIRRDLNCRPPVYSMPLVKPPLKRRGKK